MQVCCRGVRQPRLLELPVSGLRQGRRQATLTYSLNRLQKLESPLEYCVTLNRTDEIERSAVIDVVGCEHPRVTFESLAAAERATRHGVERHTAFAGAPGTPSAEAGSQDQVTAGPLTINAGLRFDSLRAWEPRRAGD